MQTRCSGINKAGEQCRGKALSGSQYCIAHDPARVVDMTEWRRQGGKAKSNKARANRAITGTVLTTQDLEGVLSKAIRDVLAGRLEPGPANAAAGLSKALVAIREATETEARLSALEAAAGIERKFA